MILIEMVIRTDTWNVLRRQIVSNCPVKGFMDAASLSQEKVFKIRFL